MQANFIKAFRERLRRGGYKDISVFKTRKENEFIVYVTKDFKTSCYRMTKEQMENCPTVIYFYDCVDLNG